MPQERGFGGNGFDVAGRKGKLELTSILLDVRAAVKKHDDELEAARAENDAAA